VNRTQSWDEENMSLGKILVFVLVDSHFGYSSLVYEIKF